MWGAMLFILAALASGGHPTQTGCFAHPARCGYPSTATAGVPAGTKLERTGSINISDPGTVISRQRIEGKVVVEAPDVTITESLIIPPGGGSGTAAIELQDDADNFKIERSEVTGREPKNALESAVWNHDDNPGATATRTYFHGCSDCWEGSGRFNRDLIVVDGSYPGSHDENIYVCGGAVRVEHSTLINRHDQTATVFGDTSDCGGNRFIVTDSLLAGGGYVLYPQANSDSPTGYMKVTGNRFARCRGGHRYEKGSGGTACAGGSDSAGIWPYGGYYGVAAYFYLGGGNVWSGNFWDDNLKPVCLHHQC
jgi:hypothetical protein